MTKEHKQAYWNGNKNKFLFIVKAIKDLFFFSLLALLAVVGLELLYLSSFLFIPYMPGDMVLCSNVLP